MLARYTACHCRETKGISRANACVYIKTVFPSSRIIETQINLNYVKFTLKDSPSRYVIRQEVGAGLFLISK
jgi:hypothetical protein